MEVGPNTKFTLSVHTLVSIVTVVAMGAVLYTQMATEDYVDQKINEALTEKVKKVEATSESNRDNLHKVNTAIELLTKSVDNHDKNMEAFTQALIEIAKRKGTKDD